MHVQREVSYAILVVAERGPSEIKPTPADTQPAGREASTAGCPSDGCALHTYTVSQSATAESEEDLQEHRPLFNTKQN